MIITKPLNFLEQFLGISYCAETISSNNFPTFSSSNGNPLLLLIFYSKIIKKINNLYI